MRRVAPHERGVLRELCRSPGEPSRGPVKPQNEQLGAIQEDMGKLKESNLAMEVGEMKETMEKQRSQLQMLMNYSKSLKARNEQLADRHGERRVPVGAPLSLLSSPRQVSFNPSRFRDP